MTTRPQWIAVLGGAKRYDATQLRAAYECGAAIVRHGHNVLTGATTGIPYAAAMGAKDAGGLVVGISPALNAEEHVERYGKPIRPLDLVVYSGMAVEGRASLILRSAAAAVFIGGEMGTLAEFAAGWLCGCRHLGLLEGSGGVTDDLPRIAASMTAWGATIVSARTAATLVEKLCGRIAAERPPRWLDHEDRSVADVLSCISEIRP